MNKLELLQQKIQEEYPLNNKIDLLCSKEAMIDFCDSCVSIMKQTLLDLKSLLEEDPFKLHKRELIDIKQLYLPCGIDIRFFQCDFLSGKDVYFIFERIEGVDIKISFETWMAGENKLFKEKNNKDILIEIEKFKLCLKCGSDN